MNLNDVSYCVGSVRPNPSLEARPNIKSPGPRSGLAHFPPHGPGVLLSVPPQLELQGLPTKSSNSLPNSFSLQVV